jgi:hypothetical protein
MDREYSRTCFVPYVAMFRRDEKAGSLYWLGLRDKTGAYLDGGRYKLSVPLVQPDRGILLGELDTAEHKKRNYPATRRS